MAGIALVEHMGQYFMPTHFDFFARFSISSHVILISEASSFPANFLASEHSWMASVNRLRRA
jgi:hypothetical protein